MVRLSKNTLGMLIAKYRAVLLRMLRKEIVVLAAAADLLLAAPAPMPRWKRYGPTVPSASKTATRSFCITTAMRR